jgi:putative transposase
MGRAPRADEAGEIYHALNRGNAKQPFFFKDADYEAFERIIVEAFWKRVLGRTHHRALRS